MKAKQLELFKETDLEGKGTYIKHYQDWYLFDNVKYRTDFEPRKDNRYMMACNIKANFVCRKDSPQSSVCRQDIRAVNIRMCDYFKLAAFLKFHGKIVFNKKLGKAVPKQQ